MALNQSPEDGFEDEYEGEFRTLAARRGVVIEYRRDRAAIDLGLHLSVGGVVTDTRIWFQFKGIHTQTLGLEEFQKASDVALDLDIEHLRQWYRSPEPVYLVVHVESAHCFLAIDTRNLVDSRWGDEIFSPATFKPSQKEVRVRVPTSARLSDELWDRMRGHRSMRTDGQSYRGNPLGHAYDVRSRVPLVMETLTLPGCCRSHSRGAPIPNRRNAGPIWVVRRLRRQSITEARKNFLNLMSGSCR